MFDLGNVLIDWNPRHLYRRLFDDEDAMEQFLAEICSLEWHVEHDRGRDAAESCAELAARHPEFESQILAWAARSEDMVGGPIDDSVAILADLKAAGVPCYALSNMERETFPVRLERYEFLRWFDGYVISGFEGIVKPEPEIFQLLLTRFGLEPNRTLFVDDSEINVAAAAALGIRALQFETPAQLRAVLIDLDVL